MAGESDRADRAGNGADNGARACGRRGHVPLRAQRARHAGRRTRSSSRLHRSSLTETGGPRSKSSGDFLAPAAPRRGDDRDRGGVSGDEAACPRPLDAGQRERGGRLDVEALGCQTTRGVGDVLLGDGDERARRRAPPRTRGVPKTGSEVERASEACSCERDRPARRERGRERRSCVRLAGHDQRRVPPGAMREEAAGDAREQIAACDRYADDVGEAPSCSTISSAIAA